MIPRHFRQMRRVNRKSISLSVGRIDGGGPRCRAPVGSSGPRQVVGERRRQLGVVADPLDRTTRPRRDPGDAHLGERRPRLFALTGLFGEPVHDGVAAVGQHHEQCPDMVGDCAPQALDAIERRPVTEYGDDGTYWPAAWPTTSTTPAGRSSVTRNCAFRAPPGSRPSAAAAPGSTTFPTARNSGLATPRSPRKTRWSRMAGSTNTTPTTCNLPRTDSDGRAVKPVVDQQPSPRSDGGSRAPDWFSWCHVLSGDSRPGRS